MTTPSVRWLQPRECCLVVHSKSLRSVLSAMLYDMSPVVSYVVLSGLCMFSRCLVNPFELLLPSIDRRYCSTVDDELYSPALTTSHSTDVPMSFVLSSVTHSVTVDDELYSPALITSHSTDLLMTFVLNSVTHAPSVTMDDELYSPALITIHSTHVPMSFVLSSVTHSVTVVDELYSPALITIHSTDVPMSFVLSSVTLCHSGWWALFTRIDHQSFYSCPDVFRPQQCNTLSQWLTSFIHPHWSPVILLMSRCLSSSAV